MDRQNTRCWSGLAVSVAGLLLAGCSLSPSTKLTIFPSGHKLMDSTKAVRQPVPVQLPRELDKAALAAYIVEPGDTLRVQPINLDSPVRLPGDQAVLLDGTINLFTYGHLMVAGRTVEEIEGMVRAAIAAKEENPGPVAVQIVNRVSKIYYVLGEVNAPGSFPLSGRETVLDAIIAAGGLTDKASRENIILSRPTKPCSCRVVLPICYRDIVQLGDTTTNYQLAPGDRVYVSTRSCWDQISLCKPKCDYCDRPHCPCPLPPLECCDHDKGPIPAPQSKPLTQLSATGAAETGTVETGKKEAAKPGPQ